MVCQQISFIDCTVPTLRLYFHCNMREWDSICLDKGYLDFGCKQVTPSFEILFYSLSVR